MSKLSELELDKIKNVLDQRTESQKQECEDSCWFDDYIRQLLAHITAQADEIKALQDELAAIKGRLTEDHYIVRAISDELIGLVKTTASAENLNDCATNAAKSIISHVLGEQT